MALYKPSLIHHIHCFRHPFQIFKKNNPSFGINPSGGGEYGGEHGQKKKPPYLQGTS